MRCGRLETAKEVEGERNTILRCAFVACLGSARKYSVDDGGTSATSVNAYRCRVAPVCQRGNLNSRTVSSIFTG